MQHGETPARSVPVKSSYLSFLCGIVVLTSLNLLTQLLQHPSASVNIFELQVDLAAQPRLHLCGVVLDRNIRIVFLHRLVHHPFCHSGSVCGIKFLHEIKREFDIDEAAVL